MALQIKPKNKCLFGNRSKQLKIFDFQNRRQCLEYQLTGDQKSENEMELDFINTISYRKE